MAKVKSPPAFLEHMKTALVEKLKAGGIDAEVDTEHVPRTKLHRVLVVAPQFKSMPHYERQDLVWRIAEQTLSPDEQLLVSMILTLTPDECEGK